MQRKNVYSVRLSPSLVEAIKDDPHYREPAPGRNGGVGAWLREAAEEKLNLAHQLDPHEVQRIQRTSMPNLEHPSRRVVIQYHLIPEPDSGLVEFVYSGTLRAGSHYFFFVPEAVKWIHSQSDPISFVKKIVQDELIYQFLNREGEPPGSQYDVLFEPESQLLSVLPRTHSNMPLANRPPSVDAGDVGKSLVGLDVASEPEALASN